MNRLRAAFCLVLVTACQGASGLPSGTAEDARDAGTVTGTTPDGGTGTSESPPDDPSPPVHCIESWPTVAPVAKLPPLADTTPHVLWSKLLSSESSLRGRPHVTYAAERIAVSFSTRLDVLDRSGNIIAERPRISDGILVGGHAADSNGNLYGVGMSFFALDRDGNPLWHGPTFGAPSRDYELNMERGGPPVLSPDGLVFATSNDGQLRAVRTADGSLAWGAKLSPPILSPRLLNGGAADVVFAAVPDEVVRGLRAADGAPTNLRFMAGNTRMTFALGWSAGLVAVTYVNDGTRWAHGRTRLFDRCGKPLWDHDADGWPVLTTWNDQLVTTVFSGDANPRATWRTFGPDGEEHVTGEGLGTPLVAGADGSILAMQCDGNDEGMARIIGVDEGLQKRWEIELGNRCYDWSAVLSDDGVLYVARDVFSGVELTAVQTAVPGPARSSWPSRDHDARGTRWFGP